MFRCCFIFFVLSCFLLTLASGGGEKNEKPELKPDKSDVAESKPDKSIVAEGKNEEEKGSTKKIVEDAAFPTNESTAEAAKAAADYYDVSYPFGIL